MDLNYLMYFRKVAELENITKAAEQLSITQPALSRVIHNLEDEIGYKLFDRCGKNIVLNHQGELFLSFTNSTLDAYDSVKSQMRDMDEKAKERIHLSMRTSLCLLPVLVKEFQRLHPDIILDISRSLNDAGEQDADIIIDTSLEEGVGENYTTLVEEESRLLISRQLLEEYPKHPGLIMVDLPILANKKYMVMKCNNLTNQNILAFKEFCIDFFNQLESDECQNYFESDILKGSLISE